MKEVEFCIVGGGVGGIGFSHEILEKRGDNFVLLEGWDSLLYTLTWLRYVKKPSERFHEEFTGEEFRKKLLEVEIPHEKILLGARVFEVIPKENKLFFYHENRVEECVFKKLILAVGGVPIVYGNYLLPGFRGAGIFSAYQVGEMLTHFSFTPGEKLVVYGEDEYAVDLAKLAENCGLETILVYIGDGDVDFDRLVRGKIKRLNGDLRLESIEIDSGEVIKADSLAVAGKYVIDRIWREKLLIHWDLKEWKATSSHDNIVLTGDALKPDFDYVKQYENSRKLAGSLL